MKRRVDTAVQQVTVWRAAAQAIAQLQAAQEQKAAKAAKHSQKVTASRLVTCWLLKAAFVSCGAAAVSCSQSFPKFCLTAAVCVSQTYQVKSLSIGLARMSE